MTSRVSFIFISCVSLLLLGLPFLSFAQSLTYQPLVGIPGVDNAASNFNIYINQLYFLSISLAALLAVIKIIIGGVKWMLTDIVTSKSDAKNEIKGALLGLLLIVSSVLILGTINPQLRELNVLGGAPALNPLPSSGAQPARTQPAGIGSSESNVPITQTPGPGGTTASTITYDVAANSTETRTYQGQTYPVITLDRKKQLDSRITDLNCGTRPVQRTNPVKVFIGDTRVPQDLPTEYRCG